MLGPAGLAQRRDDRGFPVEARWLEAPSEPDAPVSIRGEGRSAMLGTLRFCRSQEFAVIAEGASSKSRRGMVRNDAGEEVGHVAVARSKRAL
jgi:hypothetical protein